MRQKRFSEEQILAILKEAEKEGATIQGGQVLSFLPMDPTG
jgi:hypothetical protein